MDHPWRTYRGKFNGEIELQEPPKPVTVEEFLGWGTLREAFLLRGGQPRSEDPVREYRVMRVSSHYSLPYWKVSPGKYLFISFLLIRVPQCLVM